MVMSDADSIRSLSLDKPLSWRERLQATKHVVHRVDPAAVKSLTRGDLRTYPADFPFFWTMPPGPAGLPWAMRPAPWIR